MPNERFSSRKRRRSRSRSTSGSNSGIYNLLKKIEFRLSAVERKQNKRARIVSETESESEATSSGSRDSSLEQKRYKQRSPLFSSVRERDAPVAVVEDVDDFTDARGNVEPADNRRGEEGGDRDIRPPALQDDILSILGGNGEIKKVFGDPIQVEIASRWSHILTHGLDETTQKTLLDDYLPPENCPLLRPPTVNPEVKLAVSDSVIRRDGRLVALQHHVAASMSAIGLVLTKLLSDTDKNRESIQKLSDASRLLANVHHLESVSRRELIALNLNKELKETLVNTPIGDLLFGTDLDGRLRAAKDLEKSGQQLKISKKAIRETTEPSLTEVWSPQRGAGFSGSTDEISRQVPAELGKRPRKILSERSAEATILEHTNSSPALAEPFPGGGEVVRKALFLGKVPRDSIDICLASITSSTLAQYNSGLRRWWEFCSNSNINPFVVTVPNVLEFLTLQFKSGASYGTLNSYRSAIAQIAGPDLGQDFRLKRFFKGVFGIRQPLPRYENTWDPGIVINYVKTLDNEKIPLELLTQKLAVLLALATGQRIQTLSLIEIHNILIRADKVEIKIPRRIKTSAPNRSQPFLTLPFFVHDPQVCVASTILKYLEKTKKVRGNCVFLFVTCKKPFHKATTQTIGRWIKIILSKSGLDTNIFKAQSTRHASTSAAARKGLNFDTIRLAAGWTKNSETFARFYNRVLVNNEQFINAVLSS
ncbi:uncharacterized protein LOC116169038 [Photinus pyralis]|uniref:uncharacterized protein LOC116169038 n=1 Tax=Photinus pyralis TaxID=7054 RepID=UPI0012670EEA|nr:uncharacterized protein LOC116169038 [Photinus pyralis]